tara:strand:- start:448 stop:567 length:120 start_codon:yes stop_codon:yes gene_type:complete
MISEEGSEMLLSFSKILMSIQDLEERVNKLEEKYGGRRY